MPTFDDIDSEANRRALMVDQIDRFTALPQISLVRQRALTALAPRPGHRLLEMGGGAGEVARELASLAGPCGRVEAIGQSAFIMRLASSRDNGTAVCYTVGDVTALAFPDETFDGVRAEQSLQQLPDPDLAVRELVRVARPGGRICLLEPDWSSMRLHGLPTDLIERVVTTITEAGVSMCGSMGRSLPGRLSDAGATDVVADPVLVEVNDYNQAATLLPALDLQRGVVPSVTPRDLAAAWFDTVTASTARGTFRFSVRLWVVSAIR